MPTTIDWLIDCSGLIYRAEWKKAEAEYRRVEEEGQALKNQKEKETSLNESKKRMLDEFNLKVEQLSAQLEKARSDLQQWAAAFFLLCLIQNRFNFKCFLTHWRFRYRLPLLRHPNGRSSETHHRKLHQNSSPVRNALRECCPRNFAINSIVRVRQSIEPLASEMSRVSAQQTLLESEEAQQTKDRLLDNAVDNINAKLDEVFYTIAQRVRPR